MDLLIYFSFAFLLSIEIGLVGRLELSITKLGLEKFVCNSSGRLLDSVKLTVNLKVETQDLPLFVQEGLKADLDARRL